MVAYSNDHTGGSPWTCQDGQVPFASAICNTLGKRTDEVVGGQVFWPCHRFCCNLMYKYKAWSHAAYQPEVVEGLTFTGHFDVERQQRRIQV